MGDLVYDSSSAGIEVNSAEALERLKTEKNEKTGRRRNFQCEKVKTADSQRPYPDSNNWEFSFGILFVQFMID